MKPATPLAAKTLDADWYVSTDIFARERERIFARSWICVGRAAELAERGAFFTREIAGESIIVTRDEHATLHAFYNVCRHRGTRLCTETSGTFKGSIQCPYHAWTYGLDGRLNVARNMENTPDFNRANYPLHEAELREFNGFIFVSLDPIEAFEDYIAPLVGRFSAWGLTDVRAAHRIAYDLACNWKLVFQNYSECYHCPVIHPQLEKLSASDSGRNDLTDGAFLGGYSTYRSPDLSLTMSGHTTRTPLPGVTGEELQRVYYYTIFPSMLLSLHPDYVMVHYTQPLAANHTAVQCEWYFDPGAIAQPGFDASDVVEFWDLTNSQDWHVNELTQLGLQSRSYEPGPYSQQEGLLHAFDRHYVRVMT